MGRVRKLIFISIIMVMNGYAYSQNYNLTIKIEGLENSKGNIQIGLYNNGHLFPNKNSASDGKIVPANKTKTIATFSKLKKAKYAVAVIHDEDKNGELNTNLFGIPKEGFGFSNNVIGTFGPPSFEKASVLLDRDKTIVIRLRN